jgi:hypothetical protein
MESHPAAHNLSYSDSTRMSCETKIQLYSVQFITYRKSDPENSYISSFYSAFILVHACIFWSTYLLYVYCCIYVQAQQLI